MFLSCLLDAKTELQTESGDELSLILYPQLLFLFSCSFMYSFIQEILSAMHYAKQIWVYPGARGIQIILPTLFIDCSKCVRWVFIHVINTVSHWLTKKATLMWRHNYEKILPRPFLIQFPLRLEISNLCPLVNADIHVFCLSLYHILPR